MKFLNLLIGIIIFHSLNAFATDRETIRFNIIPEDSFITYTLNTAPPQVEERFDIIEGSFDIDIYTGRCGTRFIKFNSSDFTTIPSTLPYGSFNLPNDVEGEFVENTFDATGSGWCRALFCRDYDIGGTTYCMPGSIFSRVLGTFNENEMVISGVMDIESSWVNYHFSIKAIRVEQTVSSFPWNLFLPAIINTNKWKFGEIRGNSGTDHDGEIRGQTMIDFPENVVCP